LLSLKKGHELWTSLSVVVEGNTPVLWNKSEFMSSELLDRFEGLHRFRKQLVTS
jgi:uncharacterized Fe-S radical SAM superfamily protein PflX